MATTNALDQVFQHNKKPLLNIYFTAGYPALYDTGTILQALQTAGTDMVEIGIPYSDPVADGPVIQQSNMQALENGMTLPLLFQQLLSVKDQVKIPVILMGYINPVLQYGMERFCSDAVAAGVSAVILPDLPMLEYEHLYKKIFEAAGLHLVFLISPETGNKRIKKADQLSSGFLYAVSSSATTGNQQVATGKTEYFERLKNTKLRNALMIGFGINSRQSFEEAGSYAAGAIIGSAFINALSGSDDVAATTAAFVAAIRPATVVNY